MLLNHRKIDNDQPLFCLEVALAELRSLGSQQLSAVTQNIIVVLFNRQMQKV